MLVLFGVFVLFWNGAVAERGHYVGCFADARDVERASAATAGSVGSCIDRCEERFFRWD